MAIARTAQRLVCDGTELGEVGVATTRRDRRRGLLGRDGVDGALLLRPARSVHTIGMRFAIDVAHLDRDDRIVRVTTMRPGRIGALVWRSRSVLEAEAGAFDRWDLRVGDRIEVR